jgi:AcrR family transcriptional regulator
LQRRQDLLAAAERAIRKAGPRASMDEIAAEAGITKPILYDHFGDKAGLAHALTERVADRVRLRMSTSLQRDTPPRQRTFEGIDGFLSFIEDEPQLYEFLARAARSAGAEQSQRQLVVTLATDVAGQIRSALEEVGGDSRRAVPWSFAIIGQIVIAAEWWLAAPAVTPRRQLAEDLTELVWDGLGGAGLKAHGTGRP